MKKLLLTTILSLIASQAFAKEIIVKEITDEKTGKAYFSPDKLTVDIGDTVTFENVGDSEHEVMFINVPKQVDEMIMSPMQKKDDKFSYTFTVPGTYQFHCHPHEATMKGTLIVGKASNPGETKAMNHHKMAKRLEEGEKNTAPSAGEGLVQATGKIVSVDGDKKVLKITHDPIKSLNWPKMTMNFTTIDGVDISGYKEGDAVSFTLKPVGNDDYTISAINKN